MIWRIAPTLFAALFAVRAVRPAVDSTLVGILVAMIVIVAAIWTGRRWAAVAFLAFPIALITTPAAADLSFSLVALDSAWWRVHAILSLLTAGVGAVGCIVLALDRPEPESPTIPGLRSAGLVAVGVLVGLGMIGLVRVIEPVEVAGGDLTAAERAALPRIALTNFAYAPTPIEVEAGTTHRAMLVNPSDLPHTITIDAWNIDVRVPAGREAVIEIEVPSNAEGAQEFYCAIGEHRAEGMVDDLVVISPG